MITSEELIKIVSVMNKTTCSRDPFPSKLLMSHLPTIIDTIMHIINLCFIYLIVFRSPQAKQDLSGLSVIVTRPYIQGHWSGLFCPMCYPCPAICGRLSGLQQLQKRIRTKQSDAQRGLPRSHAELRKGLTCFLISYFIANLDGWVANILRTGNWVAERIVNSTCLVVRIVDSRPNIRGFEAC